MAAQKTVLKVIVLKFAFNMHNKHFYDLKLPYSGYLSHNLDVNGTYFLLPMSFNVNVILEPVKLANRFYRLDNKLGQKNNYKKV